MYIQIIGENYMLMIPRNMLRAASLCTSKINSNLSGVHVRHKDDSLRIASSDGRHLFQWTDEKKCDKNTLPEEGIIIPNELCNKALKISDKARYLPLTTSQDNTITIAGLSGEAGNGRFPETEQLFLETKVALKEVAINLITLNLLTNVGKALSGGKPNQEFLATFKFFGKYAPVQVEFSGFPDVKMVFMPKR
jgi:hypothetical protein